MLRVGGSVVGVRRIPFLIHESHPGVVLLITYQQNCTALYRCVQPTRRAAAGERRRASGVCAHSKYSSRIIVGVVGGSVVGVHKSSFFYLRVTPWGGAATKYSNKNVLLCTAVYNQEERRRASDGRRARK